MQPRGIEAGIAAQRRHRARDAGESPSVQQRNTLVEVDVGLGAAEQGFGKQQRRIRRPREGTESLEDRSG